MRLVLLHVQNIFDRVYCSQLQGANVVMKGKMFLDVFVSFCRASFCDENFTSAKIFSAKIFSASSRVNLELASLE